MQERTISTNAHLSTTRLTCVSTRGDRINCELSLPGTKPKTKLPCSLPDPGLYKSGCTKPKHVLHARRGNSWRHKCVGELSPHMHSNWKCRQLKSNSGISSANKRCANRNPLSTTIATCSHTRCGCKCFYDFASCNDQF